MVGCGVGFGVKSGVVLVVAEGLVICSGLGSSSISVVNGAVVLLVILLVLLSVVIVLVLCSSSQIDRISEPYNCRKSSVGKILRLLLRLLLHTVHHHIAAFLLLVSSCKSHFDFWVDINLLL